MLGSKVKKYFSSGEPRVRFSGARFTWILVCSTDSPVVVSVMMKPLLIRASRGYRGVRKVKNVIGVSARDVNCMEMFAGVECVKECIGGANDISTSTNTGSF